MNEMIEVANNDSYENNIELEGLEDKLKETFIDKFYLERDPEVSLLPEFLEGKEKVENMQIMLGDLKARD